MTPDDRWAMYLAHALQGLLAAPMEARGGSGDWVALAATYADACASEFTKRVPKAGAAGHFDGSYTPPAPPRLSRPLGSYGVQNRREAVGRALASLPAPSVGAGAESFEEILRRGGIVTAPAPTAPPAPAEPPPRSAGPPPRAK